jgi:hypothetical protein
MRSILKGPEPHDLLNWKRENRETVENLRYGGGGFPAEEVRKALLFEQFHLCAYTLKSLKSANECEAAGGNTTDSCHIEHVLPQSRGIAVETIDYQNMVACHPPSHTKVACEYGAQAKKDYDPVVNPFVSPLVVNAERHFKFDKEGEVHGLTPEGLATITVLNLNHASLRNDRKAVIKGRLEPKTGKFISAAAATRLATEILQPNAQAKLNQHCVAIAQAATLYALKEQRRAARVKGKISL